MRVETDPFARDACKILGADGPEYIIHGEDIMVKFNVLQSAKVSDPKVPKSQFDTLDDTLELKIIKYLKNAPYIKQADIAAATGKALTERGKIERIGGKTLLSLGNS